MRRLFGLFLPRQFREHQWSMIGGGKTQDSESHIQQLHLPCCCRLWI